MEIPCHIQHMIINKCMSFYFSFCSLCMLLLLLLFSCSYILLYFFFSFFSFLQYILFKINTNFVCLRTRLLFECFSLKFWLHNIFMCKNMFLFAKLNFCCCLVLCIFNLILCVYCKCTRKSN